MTTQPTLQDFDWRQWRPGMLSTLVFIFRQDEVLLIHKKTGLGKGMINGPGGKLEQGESFSDCARREVKEEVGVTVSSLREVADLRFLMSDHADIRCKAYFTDSFEGAPIETREAKPFWCPVGQIPYQQMWPDDILWLPRALDGYLVRGSFKFDGQCLKEHWVECLKRWDH